LTRHFNKSIRLHQVGIRDEAKISGDCGHCGRQLCCKKFLKDLVSITSEMAEVQQCVHRGSDRLSGICGRLMCCLAYEEEGYREMFEKMPAIGAKVNVDGRRGLVVGHHMLKQTVDVEFDAEKGESVNGSDKVVVEVDLNRNKK
jgi:cell fate regulator YaaT (PSP1 superfamily)